MTATKRTFDLSALQNRLNVKPISRNNSSRYPFWNMKIDENSVVRFLPDKNEDNPWFLIEYHSHELMIDGKKRSIPCLKQYGDNDCPMCKRSQDFFTKEGKDSVRGKALYRKRSWLGQVLVVKDPLPADPETGENNEGLYRHVSLGAQIYDALVNAIKEGDVENAPQAYEDGTNFIIRKTKSESKGKEFAEYIRSKFEKYPSELSPEVVEYVEDNIVDLEELRPSKPEKSYLTQQLAAFLREDVDDEDEYEPPVQRVSSFKETVSKADSKPAALFSDDEDEYEAPAPVVKAKKAVYVPPESNEDDEDEDAMSMLNRLRGKSSRPE
jgi:hypothetical protein